MFIISDILFYVFFRFFFGEQYNGWMDVQGLRLWHSKKSCLKDNKDLTHKVLFSLLRCWWNMKFIKESNNLRP